MSSRAFSEEFADLRVRCSVVSGCREGSCRTSTQTSDKSFDRWFLIPSCLMCTNPPFLHLIAWFASKVDPQGHFWGRSCRMSPYRRHSASLKDCLSNTKPSSSIGSAVNHMDFYGSGETFIRRFFHYSVFYFQSFILRGFH